MMNCKKIYGLLAAWIVCLGWALTACSEQPSHAQEQSDYPAIFPDYVGVTIPCNIAPPDSAGISQENPSFSGSSEESRKIV